MSTKAEITATHDLRHIELMLEYQQKLADFQTWYADLVEKEKMRYMKELECLQQQCKWHFFDADELLVWTGDEPTIAESMSECPYCGIKSSNELKEQGWPPSSPSSPAPAAGP